MQHLKTSDKRRETLRINRSLDEPGVEDGLSNNGDGVVADPKSDGNEMDGAGSDFEGGYKTGAGSDAEGQ